MVRFQLFVLISAATVAAAACAAVDPPVSPAPDAAATPIVAGGSPTDGAVPSLAHEPTPVLSTPASSPVTPTPARTGGGAAVASPAGEALPPPREVEQDPVVALEGACCIEPADFRGVWVRTPTGQRWIDQSSIRGIVLDGELPVPAAESVVDAIRAGYWATDPRRNAVVHYDIEGKELARIGVGELPDFVLAGSDAVWVSNLMDGTVSRIGPDPFEGHEVTHTIAIGESEASRAGPMAEGGGHVWVNDVSQNRVVGINLTTVEVDASIDLDHSPCGITFAAERLWVGSCGSDDAKITVLDPSSEAVVGSVSLPGYHHPALGLALGRYVWFVINVNDEPLAPSPVIAIDPETLAVVDSVLVDQGLTSITDPLDPFDFVWATGPRGVYRIENSLFLDGVAR